MNNSKAHDYIDRCPFCKKYMTTEQMDKHECEGTGFSGIKEIPVSNIYDLTEGKRKVIIAHGYDGIMYRLVETTNPFGKNPSDGSYHESLNRRKVTRTKRNYL